MSHARVGQHELNVHRKAAREGLSYDAKISYIELPICTHQNAGAVGIETWPILLPADLESGPVFKNLFLCGCRKLVSSYICALCIHFSTVKVAAMIKNGDLRFLTQLDKMEDYWKHLLKDYPNHPVVGQEAMSVPLTLYGPFPVLKHAFDFGSQ